MRIIAFCGPKGSGKDQSAKFLLARNSVIKSDLFLQVNFADTLKSVCGTMFGLTFAEMNEAAYKEVVLDRWPYKSPRDLMQTTARLFRTMFAPEIFVMAWERKIKVIKAGCIVCTDLRHQEEYDLLRMLDAKIFYVENKEVEAARLKGIAEGDPLWSDPSEAYIEFLKATADEIIPNDGASLDMLYANVQTALCNQFGDWSTWGADTPSLDIQKSVTL